MNLAARLMAKAPSLRIYATADVLDRTEGVTASFLKELLRRAALVAAASSSEGALAITADGVGSHRPFPRRPARPCIFEYIYFARPDSIMGGVNVGKVRMEMGRELARRFPVEADIVVPVPDSGVPAAIGYSQESGIPYELGIIRNHYVGRTFIEPSDRIRHLGVKLKHNANREKLKGKRIVLVDDSIVRGTTSRKIVRMVREAGAKEVVVVDTIGACGPGRSR